MGLDHLGFRPLTKGEKGRWRPPTNFSFVPDLETIPLSETELLQTSHHLPLLVEVEGPVTRVVAAVGRRLVRQPVVDEQGRWLRAYSPLALRCLPFRLALPKTGDIGASTLTMTDAFAAEGSDGATTDPAGDFSRAAMAMSATLIAATRGMATLGHAADRLVLADLLVPVGSSAPQQNVELLTLSLERLSGFTAHRASALILDGFLPMHLLFAMIFSRRHLTPRADAPNMTAAEPVAAATANRDDDFAGFGAMNFALDDSELVPTELFE